MKNGIVQFIKDYMEENHITYERVADKMGTTRQNVWQILYGRIGNKPTGEKGRRDPDFATVVKLLDALDLKIELTKGGTENKTAMITAASSERVPFSAAESIMEAAGYHLCITQKYE